MSCHHGKEGTGTWPGPGMGWEMGATLLARDDKKNKNKKNLKKNYLKIKKDLPHPAPEAIYNMYASVKLHIMPEPDPTMF